MPELMESAPQSRIETVTDILHGVLVTDHYRWLEQQNSTETRRWLETQTRYAHSHLESISGRERIRARVCEFLSVEAYDSLLIAGDRYFFRKRAADAEQASIYMREGCHGRDELLIDPAEQGDGKYAAVRPLSVSPHGDLLLFEKKYGGERTGRFEIFDIGTRRCLPDSLPHGYLRGFKFAANSSGFYYAHESSRAARPSYRAAYYHIWGTPREDDQEIFFAGEHDHLRLCLTSEHDQLGFLVYRFADKTYTSFYLKSSPFARDAEAVLCEAPFFFSPILVGGNLLGLTDFDAPNLRVVKVKPRAGCAPEFQDLISESSARIQRCERSGQHLLISYLAGAGTEVRVCRLDGILQSKIRRGDAETIRIVSQAEDSDEIFFETESFAKAKKIFRYDLGSGTATPWVTCRQIEIDSALYGFSQTYYRSSDGTEIPILLFGRKDFLENGRHPVVMTGYGGYGISMTAKFSVFVMFLVESGCLFALPQIRGGSEGGGTWHEMGRRQNREKPIEDFIAAAEWLIRSGRTTAEQLATFGGSNSGLLVMAAMVKRPDLFCCVLSMAPLLDMLRYHLFDTAHAWTDEFGTAEDPSDFATLLRYSPYHNVRDGTSYPSVLFVSGDEDRTSNGLHARKMTARLQAASASGNPILLDYNEFRGHAPVLPFSARIEGLTDRLAFVVDRLRLPV